MAVEAAVEAAAEAAAEVETGAAEEAVAEAPNQNAERATMIPMSDDRNKAQNQEPTFLC